jgi:hypothetical protein
VAWVCDQDAYACSGQKCSAQSILFMHEVLHYYTSFFPEQNNHSTLSLFFFLEICSLSTGL